MLEAATKIGNREQAAARMSPENETPAELRVKAARARRMAAEQTDAATKRKLMELANDLEARAAAAEAQATRPH